MSRYARWLLDRYPDSPAFLACLIWTGLLCGLALDEASDARRERFEFATAEARAVCRMGLAYTRSIVRAGGFPTPAASRNSLADAGRQSPTPGAAAAVDVATSIRSSSTCLVQVVHQDFRSVSGVRSRLLGLGTNWVGTAADVWESAALQELAKGGTPEVFEVGTEGKTNVFHYMGALWVEDSCVACHAQYRSLPTRIAGALRLDIPLGETALSAADHEHRSHVGALAFFWLVGVAGIRGASKIARERRSEREAAFAEVGAREECYRRVIESSPDGFWVVDLEARIREVNDVYVVRSGYRREELLRMRIGDLDASETANDTAQRIAHIRQAGNAVFRVIHRTKDGTLWPAEAKATYSPAGGGCICVFVRDLSRLSLSDALVETRGQLADLAQTAGVDDLLQAALDRAELLTGSRIGFFHFVDADQERLTMQSWSSNTLRTQCNAEGKGRHYPVSQAGVWVDCLKAGRSVIHNDYASLPHRHGLPEGHAPVVRELVVPVRRGNRTLAIMGVGNKTSDYVSNDVELVEGVASIVTDLVLRKRAQEELAHFFRLVPSLVCIASAEGEISRLNREWETVLGFPLAELQSRPFLDFVHPDDRRASVRHFLRAVRGRSVHRFVNRCRACDGGYRFIEWNAAALSQEGLVFAGARDITESRRAEHLVRLQRDLGLALSNLNDFRSVLQVGLERAIEAAGMDCGGLYLKDASSGDLILAVHSGLSAQFVEWVSRCPADSANAWMVEQGGSVFTRYAELVRGDPAARERNEGLRAMAVLSMRHNGRIIGCLNIASHTSDDIPEWARRHLEAIVPQISTLISRARTQEALRESEQRLRLLFDGGTDAIFLADAVSGCLTDCNPAAEALAGRTREELLGRHESLLHPSRVRATVEEKFREYASGQTLESAEIEIERPDGTSRTVWVSPSLATIGGQTIVQGIFHDITARKQAEAEARRHQVLLEAIYEHTPFMLCLINEQGEIERMNRAMVRFAGDEIGPAGMTRLGNVLGCLNALHRAEGCGFGSQCQTCTLRLAVAESFDTGSGQQHIEITLPGVRHGRRQDLRLSASTSLVTIEGARRLLLCIEDITAVKELETQFLHAQKLEAIGQLAGGVAHDFNNILGAMMMQVHLLQETASLDADSRESLRELETETQRAAGLTRQLLLFGRREVAQIRRVNLNDVVESLLKMLRRILGEHVNMQFDPHPAPLWMDGDPGMLEQVVMNLCVNARDAMPKGGPLRLVTTRVEVTAEQARHTVDARVGTFICLSVADQGTGIDPETLERIFEPFFTTKPAGKGTGLGLATVYGIVRQHLGWIEVQSVVGTGTTFRVFLPALSVRTEDATARVMPANFVGTETILLVEDDDSLLRTASRMLRLGGYRVHEARNGPEALRLWQEVAGQVHLLFTDIVMPGGMTGLELAEALLRSNPGLRVLVASGYSTDLIHSGGRPREGMSFLPKPYTPDALAKALRECLGKPTE